MADGEPAADGGTQQTPCACDCFCLPKPHLFPDRVATPQGEYAVAVSGEVAAGPVLHPADLVARDVGFGLETAPEHVLDLDLLRRDATLIETAPIDVVLDASRQPLVPMPVEGVTPLVAVEEVGADVVVPVELPRGATAGAVTAAPSERTLPALPDLRSRPSPMQSPTATERAEGEIAGGLSGPLRGTYGVFQEPGRLVTGELRSGPDDPILPLHNVDLETPQPDGDEEGDAQPPSPPPGGGLGGSTSSDEEESGGGGGGGRRFTPPDLRQAPPAPERPEPPGVVRPRSPPQHALGPGDAAPSALAPSLHPSARAGARVWVPGGTVVPPLPPPKTTGAAPVPGGLAAPRPRAPQSARTGPSLGSRNLPFVAPPATTPRGPDPRQLPPPVTPPALSLPPTASDKRRTSSTRSFTESLAAGVLAREPIEPGPAGGPRERVRAEPPKTPGQFPAHLLRRTDGEAEPVGQHVSPRTYGSATMVLPQDTEQAVEQPEALPDPHAVVEPRLAAPEYGAVSGSFPAEPTLSVAVAPATIADDVLASLTAQLRSGATVVPAGTFGGVGGGSATSTASANAPPPQLAGGGRSQPSFRGKPSGKVGQYAQLHAQLSPVADEAERLREAATALDERASSAREEEARQQSVFDAEVAKQESGADFDKDALLAAQDASIRADAAAFTAERDATRVRQQSEATQELAEQIGGELDVVLGELLKENPETGQTIATAVAKRQLDRAKKEAQKRSQPYYRDRDARKRSTERYKETKLDAKKRRKLSAAEYAGWRQEQDAVEAAKDHRVLSELREKEEQGRLTAAERREKKEIEKRQGEREARAKERAKAVEGKGAGGDAHVSNESAPDQAPAAPAAPVAPEPDPCAGCTCDPKCEENEECVCVPRAEEQGAGGPAVETPGGHDYASPPDWTPPLEPLPAVTKTMPAKRREPPRHPDRVKPPPPRPARDPCEKLRAKCLEVSRDEHWLHELEWMRRLEVLHLELKRTFDSGVKHSSGGPDLAEWAALRDALGQAPTPTSPLAKVREYARSKPGPGADPCLVYRECLAMEGQLDAWANRLADHSDNLQLLSLALLIKLNHDGIFDDHLLDVAGNPFSSFVTALLSSDTHREFMDLMRILITKEKGWRENAKTRIGAAYDTMESYGVWRVIAGVLDLALTAVVLGRGLVSAVKALRAWRASTKAAAKVAETKTVAAIRSGGGKPKPPPVRPPVRPSGSRSGTQGSTSGGARTPQSRGETTPPPKPTRTPGRGRPTEPASARAEPPPKAPPDTAPADARAPPKDPVRGPQGPGKAGGKRSPIVRRARPGARGGTYVLRDPETGQVVRTGRTNDLSRRAGEHARDPALRDYVFEEVHRTDVYAEQRGLEQMLHEHYNAPLDKINAVSPANPRRAEYTNAARSFLEGG